MVTTRAYIDGFNLYYGVVRPNRLHWLDLDRFAQLLNNGDPVDKVIYCTAMVSSDPSDPTKANRQDTYHRALAAHCSKVEILKGNFSSNQKYQPLTSCGNTPTCAVKVIVRNEKGSDVNLASRFIHDAHTGRYERAIVVSGDSDLVEAIRLVTREVGKEVWVRNPRPKKSAELTAVATNYATLVSTDLAASQLPDPVIATAGKTYHKPTRWSVAAPTFTRNTIMSAPCTQAGCTKVIRTHRW